MDKIIISPRLFGKSTAHKAYVELSKMRQEGMSKKVTVAELRERGFGQMIKPETPDNAWIPAGSIIFHDMEQTALEVKFTISFAEPFRDGDL